jgi:hypothetical protein
MSYSYFANEFFSVNQQTNIYAQNFPINNAFYDYVFEVNLSQDSLNNMFDIRHFKQNSNQQNNVGENLVDVDFLINRTFVDSLLTDNKVGVIGIPAGYLGDDLGFLSGEKMVGLRFLEVVAMKIFGHAKARAAISNDTDFYKNDSIPGSLINQMIGGLQSSIFSKRNEVFNQYVKYDRIETDVANDVDVNVNFNFQNSEIIIPMYFLSSLDTNSNVAGLQNGPIGIGLPGVSLLVNGSMNVPILVKFKSYVAPIE